jgi:hypothetical protein
VRAPRLKQPSVLPGFGLTFGFTLSYLARRSRAQRWGAGEGLAVARLAPGIRVSFGTHRPLLLQQLRRAQSADSLGNIHHALCGS